MGRRSRFDCRRGEAGSDIRKGKKTLIVSHFFQNASEEDKAEFMKVFGKYAGITLSPSLIQKKKKIKEETKKAIELLKKYGSIEYAAQYAKNLVKEANEALKVLPESEARKDLEMLAEFLVKREF